MEIGSAEILRRLGAGESIAGLCRAAGISREQFDDWWRTETARRLAPNETGLTADVAAEVVIARDDRGIPHILADNDDDLFFGYGYAMAGDRLFQLDYLRRKGAGRLAAILGAGAVESDLVARTMGFRHIAAAEWEQLPEETRQILTQFTAGVNAYYDAVGEALPIEFALLDYRPEPWTEVDFLTIEVEFRWYLTGRIPVIAIPEVVKRTLDSPALFAEFLLGEADDESILYPGEHAAVPGKTEPVGAALGSPYEAHGSNNWVLSGERTTSGRPLIASDPHIAFEAVSCWYEAHLCGGSYDVAGTTYVGMPAILFGSNPRVAWGCTNNICSQRDMYQEQTDPAHPGAFLYDGQWEPAQTIEETIEVKNAEPVKKTIRFSRNGPIVDEILPPAARGTGPVSLRWLGRYAGGWLTALLKMNRAESVESLIAATEPWQVPTWSIVAADDQGHIGYKATGRIPIRGVWERGYRPGWDPAHQWSGVIPFAQMPQCLDPQRGWIGTANNRVASDDFPYPLSGTWSSGHRARRVRQMTENGGSLSRNDMAAMQRDSLSLRAVECVPHLVRELESHPAPEVREATAILGDWNCRCEPDEVGPTLFNVFFAQWCRAVTEERFDDPPTVDFVAFAATGIASRLLAQDRAGWFHRRQRTDVLAQAMQAAIDELTQKLGPEMAGWTWERWHRLPLPHVLGRIGDLGELLDHGGDAAPGDMTTVCNTGYGIDGRAATGAGFRMIADFSGGAARLAALDAQSQSGQPGSPHYDDQLADWLTGRYHDLPLGREAAREAAQAVTTLKPVAVAQ